MRTLHLAVLFAVAACIVLAVGVAATGGPPAPTNVEQTGATETSVTIAWGPTMPGPFTTISVSQNARTVVIGWGASEDSRGPVTYRVSKDGGAATTVSQPQTTVTAGRKAKTFRVCVTPVNSKGQTGPQNCATYTLQPL